MTPYLLGGCCLHVNAGTSTPGGSSPGYCTYSKNKPEGGAVHWATGTEGSDKSMPISEGGNFRRPISTRTPTILRTIFQRKCDAPIRNKIKSPCTLNSERVTTTIVDAGFSSFSRKVEKSCLPRRKDAAELMASTSSSSLTHHTKGLPNAVRRVAI